MFLESITVVETSPCIAEKDKLKAVTQASVDLTKILPYLNAVIEKPNYQENAHSLTFKKGIIGYTLMKNQINITKFSNNTELRECLEWVKFLINDTYNRRDEITPNHKSKKIIPALKIYGMLPKTNCKRCGEKSCMAFATKLNKADATVEQCPPLWESEYSDLRERLMAAIG